jgi:hypothetical protein
MMHPDNNKKQLIIELLKRDPEIIFFEPSASIQVKTPLQLNFEMYVVLLESTGFPQVSIQSQVRHAKA